MVCKFSLFVAPIESFSSSVHISLSPVQCCSRRSCTVGVRSSVCYNSLGLVSVVSRSWSVPQCFRHLSVTMFYSSVDKRSPMLMRFALVFNTFGIWLYSIQLRWLAVHFARLFLS